MTIYTDGSRIGGGVGATLTCWRSGTETLARKYVLPSFCTVFQAELFALYQATKIALGSSEETVCILSDSRSALELLGDQNASQPIAFFVKENLKRANKEGKNVRLFWVKAYVGISGNERADELAKIAAKQRKYTYQRRPCFQDSKNYKIDTSTGSYNHGGYGEYLAKYKLKDSSKCECDPQEDETVIHLLTHCPIFSRARMDTEQKMDKEISIATIPELLQNKKTSKILIDFCVVILFTDYCLRKNGSTQV